MFGGDPPQGVVQTLSVSRFVAKRASYPIGRDNWFQVGFPMTYLFIVNVNVFKSVGKFKVAPDKAMYAKQC